MKKLFVFLFVILLSFYGYSQESPIDSVEINKFNSKVVKLFKRSKCKYDVNQIEIINIYQVHFEGKLHELNPTKGNFLQHIRPSYFRYRRKNYLNTESFIFKKDGQLIATSDGKYTYCIAKDRNSALISELLIEKAKELALNQLFHLAGSTSGGTLLGLGKTDEVFVLRMKNGQATACFLEDYQDEYEIEYHKYIKLSE